MEGKEFKIGIDKFQNFLQEQSDEMVRKVLRRLEVFGINDSCIKESVKDTIHGNFRDFPKKLVAFLYGFESFTFEIKSPNKK